MVVVVEEDGVEYVEEVFEDGVRVEYPGVLLVFVVSVEVV